MDFNQNKKKESYLGLLAIFAWCVIYAIANVYTGYIEETINPMLLCFGIFLIASIFFLLSNFNKISRIFKCGKANFSNILLLNITTLICWILTFYPLKYIEPAIVNSIIMGILPSSTLISSFLIYKKAKISWEDYLFSILLVIGIFFLAIIYFNQKTAILTLSRTQMFFAFLGCVLNGLFLGMNNIYAKKLSNTGFTPLEVLSFRFILITIFSSFFCFDSINILFEPKVFSQLLILAFSLIIFPQILVQYAIRELEPVTASLVTPLMPVLVFFLESYNVKLHLTSWTLIGVMYIGFLCIVVTLLKIKLRVS